MFVELNTVEEGRVFVSAASVLYVYPVSDTSCKLQLHGRALTINEPASVVVAKLSGQEGA